MPCGTRSPEAYRIPPQLSPVEAHHARVEAKYGLGGVLASLPVLWCNHPSKVVDAAYKSVQLAWLTTLLGGYEWARWEHFWLTVGYVLFFLVHITQVVRAGWNNFRAMITGHELAPVEEAPA